MRGLILLLLAVTCYAQIPDSGCGNPYFMIGYEGGFTSMNFNPELQTRYDHNAYCYWVIETSSATDQVIELDFLYHSIEGSVNCVYDSVSMYDGGDATEALLRRTCGHSIPNPTHSTGKLMFIEFVTDSSVAYFGFEASWFTRNRPVECGTGIEFRCGDDISGYCIPISQRCDGVNDCPQSEDELDCPANSEGCGQPEIAPNTTIAANGDVSVNVIGGWEAVAHSWPWQATLQRSFQHACGGVIISNSWIATAASCVSLDRLNPNVFDVITGNHVYTQVDPYEAVYDLDQIFVHPSFGNFKEDYNLALIKTRGMMTYNAGTKDICLFASGTNFPDNSEAWITGWGTTNLGNDNEAPVLMQGNVDIFSKSYCNDPARYNGELHNSLMCAGHEDGSIDACNGDEGGPLSVFVDAQAKWYLAGITSLRDTTTCATVGLPGVYMDISTEIEWVNDILFNN